MGRAVTHEYVLHVLNYDPATGHFTWRVDRGKRAKAGTRAGSVVNERLVIGINGFHHHGPRLAWFYVHGVMPIGNVVPVNDDFLDCRIDNLRHETQSETTRRARGRSNSTSGGVKGVSWNTEKRKWVASLRLNYSQKNLGYFNTIEEAKAAYDVAVSNVPALDNANEKLQSKRIATALLARQRRAWHRVVDENGNCQWSSFELFIKDIGTPPRDGSIIVPIDASQPMGPDNFTWAKRAKFDHRTQEGRRDYIRHARAKNFSHYRAVSLRKSFGIELHEYKEMLDSQGGVCAICGNSETVTRDGVVINLAVDHCHTTGAVRGLLCRGCNHGIGNFRDDAERLRKAVAYVERHAAPSLTETSKGDLIDDMRHASLRPNGAEHGG